MPLFRTTDGFRDAAYAK